MRFLFFFAFFPRIMKVSVRSLNILCKLTNQGSCPDSVHVLYISMEFLAANCRSEKPSWVIVLRFRLSSSFVELKGHEHVVNAVTVGMTTCFCTCFLYNDDDLQSDYLTWKWHPYEIYTSSCLCLSYGSIKLLLL